MYLLRLFLLYVYASCTRAATVRTRLGDVEGGKYITNTSRIVYTFLGVPYAQPPIGENRFEEPRPISAWSTVWEAKKQRPLCAQFYTFDIDSSEKIVGDEDCLYLSIFTPSITIKSRLPVLVYFHGGAFMMGGGGGVKPDFLLEHIDLVFVTVDYRLGPFGFLSTQDNVVPGNNGLKDQVMALKWVQENIDAFGGNNDDVTISGNSAGGASVHYHFLSPLSRGLFKKGISSSGSSLMPWAYTEEPLQKAEMLANALDCDTKSTSEMVKCLKQKPSNEILSKIEPLFMPWLYNPFSPFGPVVENTTKIPFLNKHPYDILKSGDVYNGPWLVSITTQEGLYPAASFISREEYMAYLNKNWLQIAPHLLDYNYTVQDNKRNYISNEIYKFYLGNNEISTKTADRVVEMIGDRLFKVDMDYASRIQAYVSPSPVYFLTFGYRGSFSLSDVLSKNKNNYGVSHYDDIGYVFLSPGLFKITSESDMSMVKHISGIWSSFIQLGYPTLDKNIQWYPMPRESVFTGNVSYLFIDSNGVMYMKTEKNYGNKRFWTSLGFSENSHYELNNMKSGATPNIAVIIAVFVINIVLIFVFLIN